VSPPPGTNDQSVEPGSVDELTRVIALHLRYSGAPQGSLIHDLTKVGLQPGRIAGAICDAPVTERAPGRSSGRAFAAEDSPGRRGRLNSGTPSSSAPASAASCPATLRPTGQTVRSSSLVSGFKRALAAGQSASDRARRLAWAAGLDLCMGET
jgi:hypothetical protein